MKTAAAIVTNRGGRTCHAAIVARELGHPCGGGRPATPPAIRTTATKSRCPAPRATSATSTPASLPLTVTRIDLSTLPRPRTHVMVNLGNPGHGVPDAASCPNDGVGLARMEFIIAEHIKVHPMALRASGAGRRRRACASRSPALTDRLSRTSASYFVEQLAEGVGTIAAAFYPRPVIVRLSDFKTNEYASLLGGRGFEPTRRTR